MNSGRGVSPVYLQTATAFWQVLMFQAWARSRRQLPGAVRQSCRVSGLRAMWRAGSCAGSRLDDARLAELFPAALAKLHHRGPDARGHFQDRNVFLGHTRLQHSRPYRRWKVPMPNGRSARCAISYKFGEVSPPPRTRAANTPSLACALHPIPKWSCARSLSWALRRSTSSNSACFAFAYTTGSLASSGWYAIGPASSRAVFRAAHPDLAQFRLGDQGDSCAWGERTAWRCFGAARVGLLRQSARRPHSL